MFRTGNSHVNKKFLSHFVCLWLQLQSWFQIYFFVKFFESKANFEAESAQNGSIKRKKQMCLRIQFCFYIRVRALHILKNHGSKSLYTGMPIKKTQKIPEPLVDLLQLHLSLVDVGRSDN